ncbi:histone-lysine N-methyltransferase family member SUVH2 [Elaeis guineensis]|uniref:Histone-lysine N-methyltransferase family member SUVH9 n=1 Tax=Elaeis guineensis var. tenera TaxID=51953 RepID=A0A6J0PPH1_ELAGV|nr:histone-lysine N-methyltransferase family member SUVH9 [Elaeis guineensis]XP_010936091.1 histone-lysine N-methyltransferase family member SUVH9 [Elaeis guineensis]XP_019709417.1 histone-lysine N-methyltransferase family member SUVH9 [Elaeis guineensis]
MDPPRPPITFLDLNQTPHPLISPKIEPGEQQEPSNGGGNGPRFPLPSSNPHPDPFLLADLLPRPRQVTPGPDGDELVADYLRRAESYLASYVEGLHRRLSSPFGAGAAEDAGGSKAIVPAPDAAAGSSTAIVPPSDATAGSSSAIVPAAADLVAPKKKKPRSAEMVRVSSVPAADKIYLRDVVRRARITFESLRHLLLRVEERTEAAPWLPPPLPPLGRRARADLAAAGLMKHRDLWLNRDRRIIGSIPGIEIGDVFFYRVELCVVGLHGQMQAGIDYVRASQTGTGEPIATSIIVSGGYEDDDDRGDVLIYTGHGGREKRDARQSVDQELKAGNLALKYSMDYGIEIRVIRGSKTDCSPSGKVYVYDGLYKVVDCWNDAGKSGFGVYKYKLVRIEGQQMMGSYVLKLAEELKVNPLGVKPVGYLSLDISNGKETLPVFIFNDIDDDKEPLLFEYLARPFYPSCVFNERGWVDGGPGCQCASNCSFDCHCARRNGGEFAYDGNGLLLKGKPLIYECGTLCQCPMSCANRVSQKGVRNQLEVFRSRETGWGVRSLDFIRAGAFVCEFSGVVLKKERSEFSKIGGDSLIHPSRFPGRWMQWGDISDVFPDYTPPSFPSFPELSFSIDVSRMRNVACYLSHTCSPNVFVQFVLYDHYNESYPHLMVFAMENIPPLTELSIDYGVGDESVLSGFLESP